MKLKNQDYVILIMLVLVFGAAYHVGLVAERFHIQKEMTRQGFVFCPEEVFIEYLTITKGHEIIYNVTELVQNQNNTARALVTEEIHSNPS